jgi:Fe-S oxidoreductase
LSKIDLEASETFGVVKIEEVAWKHLIEFDACTLCLTSLDSAVKVLNLDQKIRVMDVLELVAERLRT